MRDRPGRPRVMMGCATAIVSPGSKLLIIGQERDDFRDWGYPGGALEPGESLQECAIREAFEETGLSIHVQRLLSVTEFWRDGLMHGVGCLFLASPEPWPQDVLMPERDGETVFIGHRWIDRADFESLQGQPEYDFGGLGWPEDVAKAVMRRQG